MNRRMWMKWAAAAPVYGIIAARSVSEKVMAAGGKTATIDVYRRLGVRPFINARGTWTYLSGSLELPEVRTAMDAASHHFVDMFELQRAAGRRLGELSGAESGIVTSGAAGAMAQTAAPAPNASGSQVTNPNTYGATVPQNQGAAQAIPAAPGMTGTCAPMPNAIAPRPM